jgi:TRAP-type mannitol/chloroaromatic compound transport system permease small subunit
MRACFRAIDLTTEWTARLISWLCVALVLVLTYDVVMRYVFGGATIWAYETAVMLGAAIYVMGWAYIESKREHIRIDVLFMRLPSRAQLVIDIIGNLVFLLPLLVVMINTSVFYMLRAWRIHETLAETFWYPPAGPFKTMLVVGLFLFALQSAVQVIRNLYLLIRRKTL